LLTKSRPLALLQRRITPLGAQNCHYTYP